MDPNMPTKMIDAPAIDFTYHFERTPESVASQTLQADSVLERCSSQLGCIGDPHAHLPSLLPAVPLVDPISLPSPIDEPPTPSSVQLLPHQPTGNVVSAAGLVRVPKPRCQSRSLPPSQLAFPSNAAKSGCDEPRKPVDDLYAKLSSDPESDYAIIWVDRGQIRGKATEGFLPSLPVTTRLNLSNALRSPKSRCLPPHAKIAEVSSKRGSRRRSRKEPPTNASDEPSKRIRIGLSTVPKEERSGDAGVSRIQDEFFNPGGGTTMNEPEEDFFDDWETEPTRDIVISDQEKIVKFYVERFKLLQQIPCKSIAKDWIKAIEPRKQARYPYNGGKASKTGNKKNDAANKGAGELTRPPWWPREGCPHREPDHIHKEQRLVLLLHLLRNLWQPDEGPRKSWQCVDMATLRRSTEKTSQAWAHQEKYEGISRYLDEIYEMRYYEEQFVNGGYSYSTIVTFRILPDPKRESKRLKRSPGAAATDHSGLETDKMDNHAVVFSAPPRSGVPPHSPRDPRNALGMSMNGHPRAVWISNAREDAPMAGDFNSTSGATFVSAQNEHHSQYLDSRSNNNPSPYHNNNSTDAASAYTSPRTMEPTHAGTSWPVNPGPPWRKRPAGSMEEDRRVPEYASAAYTSAGPSTAVVTYPGSSYYRSPTERDGSNIYSGRSMLARQPVDNLPGNTLAHPIGTGLSTNGVSTAPPTPTSLSLSNQRHSPGSGQGVPSWPIPPLPSLPNQQPTIPNWQGHLYNDYSPGVISHTQPSTTPRHDAHTEVQHRVANGFPNSSQPGLSMTMNGWEQYSA